MSGSAEGYRLRPQTLGIIVHHTVTGVINPLAVWQKISQDHVDNGWAGIGYTFGIDPDGTVRLLGNIDSERAHIYDLNDKFIGVALLGDFTNTIPTLSQLEGLKQAVSYLRGIYGDLPCYGHRDKAVEGHGTQCPGDTWIDSHWGFS